MTLQANLTNRDATRMPHPLVKWSYEPPRAEDVPLALAHGAHLAALPPKGPVFVSLPMDDWYAEVDEADARHAIERRVTGRAVADPEAVRALAERLDAASNPVLVAGPDIDASGGWDAAVALAERQRLPVWATPGDRRRPARLPRGPPQLPRRPAAGDRPGRADARGPRPDPRRRQLGLPLLPPHPRPAAARGGEAGRDHQRPRRGGPGADGRRDRRRRRAHPRGAARGGARVLPPGARAEPGPAGNPRDRPAQLLHRPLGPRRGPARGRDRRPRVARQHPGAAQPAAPLAARAATTSAPAAASASASPPRSACSSPSPTARSSACSARARPSTRSPPSGAPSPTRPRSPSSSCSNERVRDPQVVRRRRAGRGRARPRPAGARRRRGRRAATGSSAHRATGATRSRDALAAALASSQPELVEVPVAPGMSLF